MASAAVFPSAVQDRTQEFRSCVASLSRLQNGSGRPHSHSSNNQEAAPPRSAKSEFALRASSISKEIAETTGMLQRLALLAKRKTLFDDRPVEIIELTYVIKQKLAKITNSITELNKFVTNGSSKQNAWGTNKGESQVNEHSNKVVVLLKGKLENVTTGFAQVLETRTKNIQASRSRTEQFISSASSSVKEASQLQVANSPLYGSRSPGPGQVPGNANGSSTAFSSAVSENPYASIDDDSSNPYGGTGADKDYLALPQQQVALLEEQQSMYASQRSSAVEAIESTLQELGGIFAQLANLVAEQRETVQRIDANTEDISINVGGAQRELLRYYARISSNRWLYIKSFAVIIFFFLIWVLVS